MARRRDQRGLPQSHSSINLAQQEPSSPITPQASSTLLSLPRATSPSPFVSLLSKPSKWFSRPSASKSPSPQGILPEPSRPRKSSASRRPTISGPSDRRPMLSPHTQVVSPSSTSPDHFLPSTESEFSPPSPSNLRNISNKSWSRSVDDLSRFPPSQSPGKKLPSIDINNSMPQEESIGSPTRAMIEAYRNGSSPSPHTLHPHYPFPSMASNASIPSTPPASLSPPPPSQLRQREASPAAHNRSLSQAPVRSSSLMASFNTEPLPALQPTSSPQRKRTISGTNSERDRDPEQEKYVRTTGFGFAFTPPDSSVKQLPAMNSGLSSVPPRLIASEQENNDATESRRTSQIVHYSAFINRHPGVNLGLLRGEALVTALSKNWKPYKAVLKGSKLYFYKPPGDRSAAIRMLFPQGLEPVIDEGTVYPETIVWEVEPSTKPSEREETRRRVRLYQGRTRHPELTLAEDGTVIRGTSDALIHEAVFGTSFFGDQPREDEWKSFASSTLLCLPRLMDRKQFETSMTRYMSLLMHGAEDNYEILRGRSNWLTRQYIFHFGAVTDEKSWNTFCSEFQLSVPLPSESPDQITSSIISLDKGRRGRSATVSSMASQDNPNRFDNLSSSDYSLLSKLEVEGLTGELQLRVESAVLARSLTTFHHNMLLNEPRPFRGADVIDSGPYEGRDANGSSLDDTVFPTFFGSDDSPHWLTRLIVSDILNVGGGGSTSLSHPDYIQASKTHLRSSLINHWIKVGEYCRLTGDRCSWKAIETALCCRAVARLDTVWKRVDTRGIAIVQTWVKEENEGPSNDNILTPWAGNVREKVAELWKTVHFESNSKDDQWDARAIQNIHNMAHSITQAFSKAKGGDFMEDDSAVIAQLIRFWQATHARPIPKLTTLQAYLSQSFAAEPRQKGRFEPYHWQRQLRPSPIHTLVPLLFVEPLPTVTFIDRDRISRGRKDSLDSPSAHPGLDEAQVARLSHIRASLGSRTQRSLKLTPSGEMSGLILRMYDGELLLAVPDIVHDSLSRPPSGIEGGLERQPSQIRVNHPGLDRKSSMVRRSSLPALSQPTDFLIPEVPTESTLRVTVKAGTLDRLVDVLISGLDGISVAVADDNGEMPLRDGKTRALRLDHEEFKTVWWSIFRSFMTPMNFFEILRKRFLGFSAPSPSSSKGRIGIFTILCQWLEKGSGAQDALADNELYMAMKNFLEVTSTPKILTNSSVEERASWTEVENARQNSLSLFTLNTRRPKVQYPLALYSNDIAAAKNFGHILSSIDGLDPEALVENLDALAAATMRAVTPDDIFATADLLEIQSVDRTGWYLSHEPTSTTEEIEIQTIYSHLQQIEPSVLISELSQESIYRFLPSNIRGLVRAHAVVRKFLMSQILAFRLGLRARQARMELLLRAIEVSRLRMSEQVKENASNARSVRSFVETAIVSAIVSPESRVFSLAWHNVATARGTYVDSMASILSRPQMTSVTNKGPLTVDIGWLLERLLEIITLPDTFGSSTDEQNLVNLEKRRHLFNIVITGLTLQPTRSRKVRAELDRVDIERLNNMHREVAGPPFDLRLLKDDAHQESLHSPFSAKKLPRPFLKIIHAQQEKCKRDRYLRDRLLREKASEHQRHDRLDESSGLTMQPGSAETRVLKGQRNRRTVSSAFFNLMRPLSSAFSSTDNADLMMSRRNPEELDFQPSGKPSLVISVVGATVAPFMNNIRLYMFHLTTEDGGRYLLQALTNSTLESWMSAIAQTAKLSTARRLTYIPTPAKPQLVDHIQVVPQTAIRHPTAVFGVDLDYLLEREAAPNPIVLGAIPNILDRCLCEIEARGLQEVGLYRIPGAASAIATLRDQFDSGIGVSFFDQEYIDVFAICDTVKTWLRSLPRPIFPEKSYYEAIHVIQMPEFEERLTAIRNLIHNFPTSNFHLLRRICEHLERITDFEEQNHMTAQALAVLFNPTLLRSPTNNFGELMHNMTHTSLLLQTLIIHFHRVFDDEGDVEPEDEIEDTDMAENAMDEHNESRSSSVPTDAIHDHDPDLEPFPSLQNPDTETM